MEKKRLVIFVFLLGSIIIGTVIAFLLTSQAAPKEPTLRESQQKTEIPTPAFGERSVYLDLPQHFPKDLPLVKRGRVTAAEESESAFTAVFLTTASPSDVREFYLAELPKAGFAITNQSQGGGLTIFYSKKGEQEVVVSIGRSEEGTTVSLTILK